MGNEEKLKIATEILSLDVYNVFHFENPVREIEDNPFVVIAEMLRLYNELYVNYEEVVSLLEKSNEQFNKVRELLEQSIDNYNTLNKQTETMRYLINELKKGESL